MLPSDLESDGVFLQVFKVVPSNLVSPSLVPNHISPSLSCRILNMVLELMPFSIP